MPESVMTVASSTLNWLRQRRTVVDLEGRPNLQELGSSLVHGRKLE